MSMKNPLLLGSLLVLCAFLFVSVFGISCVVAAVGDVEEGNFIYSEGFTNEYVQAKSNTGSPHAPTYIMFRKIELYADLQVLLLHYNHTNYGLDAGAPNSAYTPFTINSGGVTGSGTIGYGKKDVGVMVYLYFDSWDIGSATGQTCISVSGINQAQIYNLTLRDTDNDGCDGDECALLNFQSYAQVQGYHGVYRATYVADFWNSYRCEQFAGYYTLDIDKNPSGDPHMSQWVVWTDSYEYVNETSESNTDSELMVFEAPIYVSCVDLYDTEYSDTLFSLPAGKYKLYGYAFDAKGGFLLPGVNTTFGSGEYATDENGYYYYIVDAGEYVLNASKDGYQPLNYGAGVTLDVDSTMRYDIPLVKNETVYSGTTTVAGVVLDSVSKESVENALVKLENDSYDVYMYTNELGYFVFYNLTNTTYEIIASKSGYYTTQKDITLTDLDMGYYYQIDLVSKTVAAAPTPTPTSGADEKPIVSGIEMLFELFGLSGYMGYILALLCILAAGGTFGYITSGNTMAIAIGCFFGFVIDVALGWLPVWLVAVVLCVVIFLIVRQIREG